MSLECRKYKGLKKIPTDRGLVKNIYYICGMKYKFKLVMGDWSDDGHGESDTKICSSSHSIDEVRDAHKKLAIKGIDLLSQCDEYLINNLEKGFVEKLNSIGFDINDFVYDEDEYYVSSTDWMKLYMELAKIEIPELEYKFINAALQSICIGGYGLYSD